MHVLGVAAQMAGDLLEARDLMSQRIAIGRETGNFATVSSEAGNLSMVERQLGNLDRAEALAREALDIDCRRGDDMSVPWKVNGLAAVAQNVVSSAAPRLSSEPPMPPWRLRVGPGRRTNGNNMNVP